MQGGFFIVGKRAVQDALQQQATQKEYRDAVHKAVVQMMNSGEVTGVPVQDVANTGSGGRMEGKTPEADNTGKGNRAFDFNKYLKSKIGDPPTDMVDPHAHHILFKEGLGAAQKALVREGQVLLRRYNIDPIYGIKNLIWAPNRVAGQHDYVALKNVVDQLKEVERNGGDCDDIKDMLKELGEKAARREK